MNRWIIQRIRILNCVFDTPQIGLRQICNKCRNTTSSFYLWVWMSWTAPFSQSELPPTRHRRSMHGTQTKYKWKLYNVLYSAYTYTYARTHTNACDDFTENRNSRIYRSPANAHDSSLRRKMTLNISFDGSWVYNGTAWMYLPLYVCTFVMPTRWTNCVKERMPSSSFSYPFGVVL